MMHDFTLKHRLISGIPALELYARSSDGSRPLIIMIHGLEAAKETALPYAYRLAQAGFHTVCFDAREHGERTNPAFQSASPAERMRRLYDIIFATAADIDTVIGDFADHSRVDIDRIGLVGFSMGGMIIYHYLTRGRHPGIRAAVPIIATPAFIRKIDSDRARDPALAGLVDEKTLSEIAGRDPSRRLSALPDLPLLILNGTADELMPIDDIRAFYRQAKDLYDRKDRIHMVEYEGAEHLIRPEMMAEAAGWMRLHL